MQVKPTTSTKISEGTTLSRSIQSMVALACALMLTFPTVAWAADPPTGSFNVEGGTLGVDYSYTKWGGVTVLTSTPLEISMVNPSGSTTDWIAINLADASQAANITLAGVSIIQGNGPADALVVTNGGLNLTLKKGTENTLQGGIWNAGLQNNGNPLVIKGDGTLYAKGGRDGAGIGASTTGSAGSNITIEGGTIFATGGSRGSAGIGGGSGNAGNPQTNAKNITISGGTVTAVGNGTAAGIGGGAALNGDSGTVDGLSITGGTVMATGGTGAAGIGGGAKSIATNVSISGGNITVVANDYGSYIGSGKGAGASTVSITGGLFADKSATVADNKVYSITPAKGFETQANSDNATKASYPLIVTKSQLSGTLTLVSDSDAGFSYTGKALSSTEVVKEAKYGDTEAEESDIVFEYKEKGDKDEAYSAGLPTDAGSYTVRATLQGKTVAKETYSAKTATADFTIATASLTIEANDNAITYGDAPSDAGVTSTGFVNSETLQDLIGTLGYDFNYQQYGEVSSDSRAYTITPKGLTSSNYAITFKTGALVVAPKTVELEWLNTTGRVAGDGKQVAAKVSGVIAGDKVAATVEGGLASEAGTYTAKATALTGVKASNYQLPENASITYRITENTTAGDGGGSSTDNNTPGTVTTNKPKALAATGDNTPTAVFVVIGFMALATVTAIAWRRRTHKQTMRK